MKDKSYKMNGVIISELKRLRLFQAFICLFCSAIWILCLKNSIANKKIYLLCVILALVSSCFSCEIKDKLEKVFGSETKQKLIVIPAILLSTMVTVANWNLYRGLRHSIHIAEQNKHIKA